MAYAPRRRNLSAPQPDPLDFPELLGGDGGSVPTGMASPGASRSFGATPYGDISNAVGFGSFATGIPGLGAALGGLGTYGDVRGLNMDLSAIGRPQDVAFGPAFANSMSFGLLGTSAQDQFGAASGFTPGGISALGEINDALAAGQGPGGAGYGGDAGGGYGSSGHSGGGDGMGGEGGDAGGDGQGWMRGGYTGAGADGVVDKAAPAGPVHEGEYVIKADAVRRYGRGLLDALNDERIPKRRIAGLLGE